METPAKSPAPRRLVLRATLAVVFIVGLIAAWIAGHKYWPMEKDFTNGMGMEMVWCEPGTFMMGSSESEPGHQTSETLHKVTLTEGFWIGRYEVTQKQWKRVMGNNPSEFSKRKVLWIFELPCDRNPVECVSWIDAMKFCSSLTDMERAGGHLKEGFFYTLPTEAQWEYACRAGTKSAYYFGDSMAISQANFGKNKGLTTAVGAYSPNKWGIFDLHGNIREWCADKYGEYPSGAVIDPLGQGDLTRVIRGGNWYGIARHCRSAYRTYFPPDSGDSRIGFRPILVSRKMDVAF